MNHRIVILAGALALGACTSQPPAADPASDPAQQSLSTSDKALIKSIRADDDLTTVEQNQRIKRVLARAREGV